MTLVLHAKLNWNISLLFFRARPENYCYNTVRETARDLAQLHKCLPEKHEVVSSIPRTKKKRNVRENL